MWQIASQMFLCLLAAGLIGAVAGWALAALMGQRQAARLEETRARVAALEGDLASARRRTADAEAERTRLAADVEGALARTQELELRRRSAEDRSVAAEAGLRAVRERGEVAEEALRAAQSRAAGAEIAARDSAAFLEAARSRERAEAARAVQAEEAMRALELGTGHALEELRGERDRLQASLRDALERLEGLRSELDGSRDRAEALDGDGEERLALEQRLRQCQERLVVLEASHRALETERDGAETRVRSLGEALREGDREREEIEARLRGLEGRLRAEQEAHQHAQLRVLELTRLAEGGRRPREAVRSPAVRGPRRDDLEEIVGVGPVLARLLHRHGVHTFRQVALWTAEDIRRIDAFLHDFHGRIRRDHWVRQARTLHRRHHGESLGSARARPGNGEPQQPAP